MRQGTMVILYTQEAGKELGINLFHACFKPLFSE